MKGNYNNMKNVTYCFIVILTFSACQNKGFTEPKTLDEFTSVLAEKKEELKLIEEEINKLSDKIAELDPSLQEKSKLVDTTIMNARDFTRYINIQGAVEADDPVNAVSEIAGRIKSLVVKEGDFVKKGNIIATIDVESIDKQIDEINSSLSLARDVYTRQDRLWQQNIGSEIQFLQAKNNVERLEKSLETIKFQRAKASVFAPITGTIDMVMTRQGEVVSPGLPIVQILNTNNLKITTDIPENYLKVVRKGMQVKLNFPSVDFTTTGIVSLLGRKIDPTNRTLELEISPRRTSNLLKPNLLSEIQIIEIFSKDVITMPLEYILQEVDGTEFVYVAELDDKGVYRASKRYVSIGEAALGDVVITEGIRPGESVIFKGSRNISHSELIEFSK